MRLSAGCLLSAGLAGALILMTTVPPPASAQEAGCRHGASCRDARCGHGNSCAQSAQPHCGPLPPISFSRYANDGDFDCPRSAYGDWAPHFPNFWYAYRQPYPAPHDFQRSHTSGRGGGTVGRGVGG